MISRMYSYNNGSKGAISLAQSLSIKRIFHEGKPLRVKEGEVILNWGSSNISREFIGEPKFLNKPESVRTAVNKLQAFKTLRGRVHTPAFTESLVEASRWLAEGHTLVARTILNGHSGNGIVILNPGDDFVEAPLYTRYVKKDEEYRIHVAMGKVFFVQRKARKLDVPDDKVNWKIRNHGNGFIYAQQGFKVNDEVRQAAIIAVDALGLDFGAVDIMVDKQGLPVVLEVNTACGLEGTTLIRYTEMFKEIGNEAANAL